MDKLLLLSGLAMMIVVPLRAARTKSPGRSLRRALGGFFVANVLYWLLVIGVWFQGLHGGQPKSLLFDESKTAPDVAKREAYEFQMMQERTK